MIFYKYSNKPSDLKLRKRNHVETGYHTNIWRCVVGIKK